MAGDGHITAQADLRVPDAIGTMVDQVAKVFGKIDVLINNAGVFVDHPIKPQHMNSGRKLGRKQ